MLTNCRILSQALTDYDLLQLNKLNEFDRVLHELMQPLTPIFLDGNHFQTTPLCYTTLFVVSQHRNMCVLKREVGKADVAFSWFFSFHFHLLCHCPNYKLGGQGGLNRLSRTFSLLPLEKEVQPLPS